MLRKCFLRSNNIVKISVKMRLLFLFLFMLVSFIGKAQMFPINRTKIMRPIDPPSKTTCKFSDRIGVTILVTKYIE